MAGSLEAESIEIIREAVAGARRPVMFYSIGKDSSVMLHWARKAFHPAPPPFPLDSGYEAPEAPDIHLRTDQFAVQHCVQQIVNRLA